jgi:hypothetical protein
MVTIKLDLIILDSYTFWLLGYLLNKRKNNKYIYELQNKIIIIIHIKLTTNRKILIKKTKYITIYKF